MGYLHQIQHTILIIKDWMIPSEWSKHTLISSRVGRPGQGRVGPSYFKKGDLFHLPLAQSVPIFNKKFHVDCKMS